MIRPHGIAKNSLYVFGAQLLNAGAAGGLIIYLSRALALREFGYFALATSVSLLLVPLADLGLSASAARFLSEKSVDGAGVREIIVSSAQLKAVAAVIVSGVLLALSAPLASLFGPHDLVWALRAASPVVLGQSMFLLVLNGTVGLRLGALNFTAVLTKTVVECVTTVVFVVMGTGAVGAMAGRALGWGAGFGVGVVLLLRHIRSDSTPSPVARRPLLRYAALLAAVDGAYSVFFHVDVLLIGAFLSSAAVALFQAPLRVVSFLHYPALAVASGIAPALVANSLSASAIHTFRVAMRWLAVAQALLASLLFIGARPLVMLLFGSKFRDSAQVLEVAAPYIFFAGIAPLVSLTATYLGAAKRRLVLALGALALNVVVDVALIPRIGVVGGAVGTDVAAAMYVGGHVVICARALRVRVRALAWEISAAALAAALPTAALLALRAHTDAVGPLVVGAALAVAAFVALVALTTRRWIVA